MTRALRLAGALAVLLGAGAVARADGAPPPPPAALEDVAAFERGFAVSLFQFDACGDAVAGRLFRRALAERFARCPFTAEARERYARRTRAELAKVRGVLDGMVEAEGGMPARLAGMEGTCAAQRAGESYRAFRAQLEAYGAGALAAEELLPAACDAADVLP